MSFLAKLFLDGKTYELLDCEFDFGQKLDSISLPIQRPKSRYIRFTVESSSDNAFLSWMIAPNETRDGEFIFYRRDGMSRMRGIKFEKAYCIGYDEKFRANGVMPLQVTITLSCLKMDFGGAVYKSTAFIETNHMKPYVPPAEVPKEEVTKIRLVSPLHEGANGDGKPKSTKMGFVHGESYLIEVAAFRLGGERVQKSDVKWEYAYTKPSTNDDEPEVVICKMKETGFSVTFEADNLDMCGTNITFYAYIEKKSAELKEFHHNRFRWFDEQKVHEQAEKRMTEPWRIQQEHSSLCGMAAIYYVLAQRDPKGYERLAKELFRTGEYTYNGYTIKPHEQALEMYDMKPDSAGYATVAMPYVDWIVLATTRSKESSFFSTLIYKGVENGSYDQLKAVNWPRLMTRLTTELAGYNRANAVGLNELLLQQKKRPIGGRIYDALSNSDLEHLRDIERKYNAGIKIMMMIDAQMIEDKISYGYGDLANQSHWVVYEGGLQFFDDKKQITNDLNKAERVSFKIFTWGRDPETALYFDNENDNKTEETDNNLKKLKETGIKIESFKSTFYGYIEAN